MAYNYQILDFLATKNVVEVKSEQDFNGFFDMLKKMGLEEIFGKNKTYQSWQHLANINIKNPNQFYFEYDNARGLTWYDDKKVPEEWYGKKAI